MENQLHRCANFHMDVNLNSKAKALLYSQTYSCLVLNSFLCVQMHNQNFVTRNNLSSFVLIKRSCMWHHITYIE